MPMTPLPTGTVRNTSSVGLLNLQSYHDLMVVLLHPTDYDWAALPYVGSPYGLMKQARRVTNLVFVTQGGIGLINKAPEEGQVWPRGNPETLFD